MKIGTLAIFLLLFQKPIFSQTLILTQNNSLIYNGVDLGKFSKEGEYCFQALDTLKDGTPVFWGWKKDGYICVVNELGHKNHLPIFLTMGTPPEDVPDCFQFLQQKYN